MDLNPNAQRQADLHRLVENILRQQTPTPAHGTLERLAKSQNQRQPPEVILFNGVPMVFVKRRI